MSARRQARARLSFAADALASTAIPAPLLLGPCIEVWADPAAEPDPYRQRDFMTVQWWSARRRFVDGREAWLESRGIAKLADQCEALPIGPVRPWSAEYLADGDPTGTVARRFREAARTVADIPAMRCEVEQLLKSVRS